MFIYHIKKGLSVAKFNALMNHANLCNLNAIRIILISVIHQRPITYTLQHPHFKSALLGQNIHIIRFASGPCAQTATAQTSLHAPTIRFPIQLTFLEYTAVIH